MAAEERLPEPSNPPGMDGIGYTEYTTWQPQAFGALLQKRGFPEVARHRSREVELYRQGSMNLIENADSDFSSMRNSTAVAAIALRVRDAAFAHKHSLDLGAWDMPTRASAMELNIPGIHGVGESLIYFVDRYRDFSIYDMDFVFQGAKKNPPAVAGLHWFGLVQAILNERTRDWLDFYGALFGFTGLPQGKYFGFLPKRTLLERPFHKFYLQLIDPPQVSAQIT